jgi:hypothetical protein
VAVEASKTSLFPRVSEPGRSTSDLAISFVLSLGCFTQPRFHDFNIFRFVLEMLEGQVSSLGHPVGHITGAGHGQRKLGLDLPNQRGGDQG